MLSKIEKITKCEEFIRTTIGIDAFRTLYIFEENVTSLFSLVDLFEIIIAAKKNLIPNSYSDPEFLKIRQFLALDIILKLQVIIESTLVLSHSLSLGYHSIAQNMTYYDFNLLKVIRKNIGKKQYNARKILGLPKIGRLPIASEEKKFLARLYEQIEIGLWDDLEKCINFYEKYRIVFGKSKHGLVFHSGVFIDQPIGTNLNWKDSSIIAYDRKKREDIPKDHFVAKRDKTIIPFYNVISKLRFNDTFTSDIKTIRHILDPLIHYICQNHKTHALNCGEVYFPFEKKNHDIYLKLPSTIFKTDSDKLILKNIMLQIAPFMNTQEKNLLSSIDFNADEEVKNSMEKESVTNFYIED